MIEPEAAAVTATTCRPAAAEGLGPPEAAAVTAATCRPPRPTAWQHAGSGGMGMRAGHGPSLLTVGDTAPSTVDRLEYFARLVADDPSVARARFGYANELLHAGRLEDAVEQLRAYLALAEDEGNAWGRLGEALAALGRPEEAADAYLEGIGQAEKHGHHGMAADFHAAIEAL